MKGSNVGPVPSQLHLSAYTIALLGFSLVNGWGGNITNSY